MQGAGSLEWVFPPLGSVVGSESENIRARKGQAETPSPHEQEGVTHLLPAGSHPRQ